MIARENANTRIEGLITARWSPRSFDASAMPQEDLDVILEAAGWAASAYNIQPWTFLYAHRGDANWDRFLSYLVEFNQSWAKDASVLIFIVSDRMQGKPGEDRSPNHSHSFDAGAAWANMALQATAMGYHAHGMTGIAFGTAEEALGIPADHRLEAAVAIGRQAPKDRLPEALREREVASGRKLLSQIAKPGNFA